MMIWPSDFGYAVKLVFVVQIIPDFGNQDSCVYADDCNQLRCIRIPFLASVCSFLMFIHELASTFKDGQSSLNTYYRNSSLWRSCCILTDCFAVKFVNRANGTDFPGHCEQWRVSVVSYGITSSEMHQKPVSRSFVLTSLSQSLCVNRGRWQQPDRTNLRWSTNS